MSNGSATRCLPVVLRRILCSETGFSENLSGCFCFYHQSCAVHNAVLSLSRAAAGVAWAVAVPGGPIDEHHWRLQLGVNKEDIHTP
ncbi:hypothetical protein RRG08_042226 [Elysia crispata]|uniref:Uncharacterized protein n=1 Tax=Elysia crispata TaxID=231223 RepID=A0AAE1AST4_9GAST|nr:hypothetical protein RRG08_042226 [Elysia crispata]